MAQQPRQENTFGQGPRQTNGRDARCSAVARHGLLLGMGAELGQRLKSLRDRRGETQLQVAGAVGTDPGTYSRWERGVVDPQLAQLFKLARHFEVKPGQLLNETETGKAKEETPEFRKFRRTQIGAIAEKNGWLAYIRDIELPVPATSEIYQDIAYAILRQVESLSSR